MAQSLTNADSALKEDYQPVVREQLNNENMLLAQVEKNTEDIEGRRAVLSVHLRRSGGVGARSEGDNLPTAGHQGYAEERISVKHQYARIEISGPAIRASKSDAGSFERLLDSEMRRIKDDISRDLNRQCYNGLEGTIAQCGTTSAATTVVLASTTTDVQMRQFHVGMLVDIGTLADPDADVAGAEITAVDRTNKTITIGSAITTNSSDYVTRAGSKTGSGTTKEIIGLQAIIDSSGSLFNIDPSSYPEWASVELSNGGTTRAFTDVLLERAVDDVAQETGNVIPNLVITSFGVRRNFAAQLKSQRRYEDNVDLVGGFKGTGVNVGNTSLALIAERDCPENTAFGVNTQHLIEFVQADWQWADDDGAVLSRVSNKDAWEAFLYKDHVLATDRRNAHFKITDLATTG
jgi:hypothetical protein